MATSQYCGGNGTTLEVVLELAVWHSRRQIHQLAVLVDHSPLVELSFFRRRPLHRSPLFQRLACQPILSFEVLCDGAGHLLARALLVQLEYTGNGDDGWLPLTKHGVQVKMPHTYAALLAAASAWRSPSTLLAMAPMVAAEDLSVHECSGGNRRSGWSGGRSVKGGSVGLVGLPRLGLVGMVKVGSSRPVWSRSVWSVWSGLAWRGVASRSVRSVVGLVTFNSSYSTLYKRPKIPENRGQKPAG
mmetsp:Transcript_34625/g.92087  ORF Transcript_34625/g.92087 Transcript_34625/m.92087 type:complete len:244 (+) Transcript_34625:537-1268(+)